MNPLWSILRMRAGSLRNRVLNLKGDSVAKVAVIIFGLSSVVAIGYWISYSVFEYVEQFPAFGAILNAKTVSLLFFTLLILVVISTIIVAYTTIFLARETDFFFQHPAPPRTILFVKVTEAVGFSSWATLVLCLPVLVAFGRLRAAPAAYYLEVGAILIVFLSFAGLLGTAIALLIAPVVRLLTPRQILLGGGMLLLSLGWLFLRSFQFWSIDGENDLLILDRFMTQVSTMHSPYFPGQWASSAVLAAAAGNHIEVLFHGCTLLANTLVFLPVLAWYGTVWYGRQWVGLKSPRRSNPAARLVQDAGDPASPTRASVRHGLRLPFVRREGRQLTPLETLVLKDVLTFVRDPAQLSQSLLFVLLMVIYSLSLLRVPEFPGKLKTIIYFSNLVAVCMILSSFTSRFLYPLLSLEGKAFWILGLAPISRAYILRQKALFGLAVSFTLGLGTAIVSNMALRSPPGMFFGAVYTLILAGICLTSLSTGLGATYQVFDEDNPARIAVGLGGTLNFVASALSVAVLVAIEALPYYIAREDRMETPPVPWVVASHLLAFVYTAGISTLTYKLGTRSLSRRDF